MKKRKCIVFIAPLPPPFTGQSIISKILFDELSKNYKIISIDYSRKKINPRIGFNFKQVIKSIKLSCLIKKYSNKADILYITLSMSILGNLKDLFFLFRAGKKLRAKTIIHFHSGGFDKFYKKLFFINKLLNKYFLSQVSKAIVLGRSLKKCAIPVLPENKIEYVPNFFDDKILLDINKVHNKWDEIKKINLLFLSNFIKQKGYMEFLEGFFLLPEEYKDKCNIVFAGLFYKEKDKKIFLKKILNNKNIKYLNFIEGNIKEDILHNSHVLFLPTYYDIEGQPVCILESYAAGLAVVTTEQGGIGDIFINEVNGEIIDKKSALSVKNTITRLIDDPEKFKKYAVNNRKIAENYTKDKFILKIKNILKSSL